MPRLTIDIPDDKAPIIAEAFAEEFGWTPETGVTKAQFFKQQLIAHVKQVVRNNLANKDAATARRAKEDEINAIPIS